MAVVDLIHDVTCVPGAQQGALLLTAETSSAPAQLVPDSSSSQKKKKSIACEVFVGPAYSCDGTRGANRREAHTFTLPDENHLFCDGNEPANELTTCALLWRAWVSVRVGGGVMVVGGDWGEILPICCALHHSWVLYYEWWPL